MLIIGWVDEMYRVGVLINNAVPDPNEYWSVCIADAVNSLGVECDTY